MVVGQLESSELRRAAEKVRGLILDVDGVLTDGSIVYDDGGHEIKRFFVRDGFGIRSWLRAGRHVAVLSGRASPAVDARCKELGIHPVRQGEPQKGKAFREILAAWGLSSEEVCFVGDDYPDLPVMLASGLSAAVADADSDVRARASWVLDAPGGHGAVREAIEFLMRAQGLWDDVRDHYATPAVAD